MSDGKAKDFLNKSVTVLPKTTEQPKDEKATTESLMEFLKVFMEDAPSDLDNDMPTIGDMVDMVIANMIESNQRILENQEKILGKIDELLAKK